MRNKAFFLFIFIFLASLPIGLLYGASKSDSEISVKAEVDRAFITIGDPVQYSVTIKHDPNIQVLTAIDPPPADLFKIQKIKDIKSKEGKKILEGRQFTLTTFQLGEFILDPVQIQYRNAAGEVKKIETNRLFVTVQSVAGKEEKTDIRGVKPVVEFIQNHWGIVIPALLLLLAAAGYLIYQKLKRKPGQIQETGPLLTPSEEALQKLSELFDSDLFRRGKTKEYYLRLSEILRVFLEKQFLIPAVESTTYELTRLLRQKEFNRPLTELIQMVLEACDLAKFAKWKPEPPEIIQLNQKAKQVVLDATPPEQEATGSGV